MTTEHEASNHVITFQEDEMNKDIRKGEGYGYIKDNGTRRYDTLF